MTCAKASAVAIGSMKPAPRARQRLGKDRFDRLGQGSERLVEAAMELAPEAAWRAARAARR